MNAFNPSRALEVLNRHHVDYIVIGGIAAAIHGGSADTYLLDLCYNRADENREPLAGALREMKARRRGLATDSRFELDEEKTRNGDSFMLATAFGDLDCVGKPPGSAGYAELLDRSSVIEFGTDMAFRLCSINDLISMKRSTGRPHDVVAADLLEAIRRVPSDSQ